MRKGQEIQILATSLLKNAVLLASFFGIVWLAGGAPCNLVVPGGHWVVPVGTRGLPVVLESKMKVLESLEKVFLPFDGKKGFGGSSLHYSEEMDP